MFGLRHHPATAPHSGRGRGGPAGMPQREPALAGQLAGRPSSAVPGGGLDQLLAAGGPPSASAEGLRRDCPPVHAPVAGTPNGVIALHPEATADPQTLRWVVSHRVLPFAGSLDRAPGLDDLIGTVIATVKVGPDAVTITLAPDHSWRDDGGAVRSGLLRALEHTDAWVGGTDARILSGDDALAVCAAELIDGPIGDIARAHGGHIALAGVDAGVVTVKMSGACRGCPAAVITMHQRLENQLRRRVPGLVDVRSING